MYAYWICFKRTDNKSTDPEVETQKCILVNFEKQDTPSTKLHNPTPIHPKANQIFSFPTTLTSVVIHFPQEQLDFILPVPERNNIYNTSSEICMV